MSFIDYNFLNPTLEEWWDYRYGFVVRNYDEIMDPDSLIPDKLCKELQLTEDQFKELFLTPYKDLKLCQLQKIAAVQTSILGHTFLQLDQPVIFNVKPTDHTAGNAVDWALVNIHGLCLPGLELDEENSRVPLYLPIRQCWYCGRPDRDSRQERFNKKSRYCHTFRCKSISSAKIHDHDLKGCCLRKWKKLKGETENNFDRCYGDQKKAIKVFWDYCEDQYYRNMKTKYLIRSLTKGIDLKVSTYTPGQIHFGLKEL